MNLSKEWMAFVQTLLPAPKTILKTIFQTLIVQLTALKLALDIDSIRQQIQIKIQTVVLGVAETGLNTAKSLVTPVTQIISGLPKGKTTENIPIPTQIPEISNNMNSLYSIIQKPTLKLEEEFNKLNKLKLYASSTTSKSKLFQTQIDLLQKQIDSLG